MIWNISDGNIYKCNLKHLRIHYEILQNRSLCAKKEEIKAESLV